ncbi:hypothetical protein Pmani_023896 [Petrolisthes manimaculis]|uniref:Uncharacterized protein n=1 Tax=Petrolisthes manimaculis TaxID=1843537 RepID=A0AAE1PBG5_9EUCA|nr:hypothetical protein Pmani_023896 [Petrolisthes manimaculis]
MGGVDGLWERGWSQFILSSGGRWLSWLKQLVMIMEMRIVYNDGLEHHTHTYIHMQLNTKAPTYNSTPRYPHITSTVQVDVMGWYWFASDVKWIYKHKLVQRDSILRLLYFCVGPR